MDERPYNVLFLCTGNSARSILAEVLIEHWGKERFKGYSAGSFPKGTVHPVALDLLEKVHLPTRGLRSKSWNEFARPGAPVMDFVFTVCDQAAGEVCPVWPGNPILAHWSTPDPEHFTGPENDTVNHYWKVAQLIYRRVDLLCNLSVDKLDRIRLEQATRNIGTQ